MMIYPGFVLLLCALYITAVQGVQASANIAKNRPATQSSNHEYNRRLATAAVDGDPGRGTNDPSCAITKHEKMAWWAVELGPKTKVASVRIYNRQDDHGHRLANFIVGVTNVNPSKKAPVPGRLTECASFPGKSKTGEVLDLKCRTEVVGAYLVIQLRGTDHLQLCEVEVHGPVNIALNRPAKQSSNLDTNRRLASAAVDGNTGRGRGDSSCAVTKKDRRAWWAVDLGPKTKVRSLRIYNRNDGHGERLANFVVGVTDVDPSISKPTPSKMKSCASFSGKSKTGDILDLTCKTEVEGRYLVIQLRGTEHLQLCEVEVNGAHNIAFNQPAMQSSNHDMNGRSASEAVDGDPGRGSSDPSCAITKKDKRAWWAVQLKPQTTVTNVKIYNRNDNHGERLANFVVGVTDEDPRAKTPYPGSLDICVDYTGVSKTGDILDLDCRRNVVGKFLVIQLKGVNLLQLCEVEAYGYN